MSHVQALPLESSVLAEAPSLQQMSHEVSQYLPTNNLLERADAADMAVALVGVAAVGRALYSYSHTFLVGAVLNRCRKPTM